MLGQVVAFTHDVGGNFLFVGQADTGDFAQRGVRLSWRHGFDDRADATLLGGGIFDHCTSLGVVTAPKGRTFAFLVFEWTSFTDKLIDSWHRPLL